MSVVSAIGGVMNNSVSGFSSATFLSSTTATIVSGTDDVDDGTVDEWSESCEDCVVIVNIAQAVPLVGAVANYALPLYGFVMPILVVITTLTNTFIVIVLSQKHLRTPTNFVLLSMAIVDLLTGLVSVPWFIYYYTLRGYESDEAHGLSAFWCHIYPYLSYIVPTVWHTAGIWLTVFLAVQRYVYVCVPSMVPILCTPRRTRYVVMMTILLSFLTEMPDLLGKFMDQIYVDGRNVCLLRHSAWVLEIVGVHLFYSFIYWFRVIFVQLLPCLLLIIFTYKLARTIKRSEIRKRSWVSGVGADQFSTTGVSELLSAESRRDEAAANGGGERTNSIYCFITGETVPVETDPEEKEERSALSAQNSTAINNSEFLRAALLSMPSGSRHVNAVRARQKSVDIDAVVTTRNSVTSTSGRSNSSMGAAVGERAPAEHNFRSRQPNFSGGCAETSSADRHGSTVLPANTITVRGSCTTSGKATEPPQQFSVPATSSSMSSGRSLNATNRMLAAICCVFLLLEVPAALIFTLHFLIAARYLPNWPSAYRILNVALIIRNILIVLTSPLQFFIYCSMSEQFRLTVRQLFSSRLLFVAQAQATFHGGKRYSLILIDVELIQQQQQKYNKQQQQQHYGSQQHRVSQLLSSYYSNNNNISNTINNDSYSPLLLHKHNQQQLLQSDVGDCTSQVEVYRTGGRNRNNCFHQLYNTFWKRLIRQRRLGRNSNSKNNVSCCPNHRRCDRDSHRRRESAIIGRRESGRRCSSRSYYGSAAAFAARITANRSVSSTHRSNSDNENKAQTATTTTSTIKTSAAKELSETGDAEYERLRRSGSTLFLANHNHTGQALLRGGDFLATGAPPSAGGGTAATSTFAVGATNAASSTLSSDSLEPPQQPVSGGGATASTTNGGAFIASAQKKSHGGPRVSCASLPPSSGVKRPLYGGGKTDHRSRSCCCSATAGLLNSHNCYGGIALSAIATVGRYRQNSAQRITRSSCGSISGRSVAVDSSGQRKGQESGENIPSTNSKNNNDDEEETEEHKSHTDDNFYFTTTVDDSSSNDYYC